MSPRQLFRLPSCAFRNATIGETSLDRVSCALGGKTVLQPTLQHVTGLLKSGKDWEQIWTSSSSRSARTGPWAQEQHQ